MNQRLTFITIGVKNLDIMRNFYRDIFGWTLIKDSNDIVFIKLNGIILGLFPEQLLAEDIGLVMNNEEHGFKRFALAINFDTGKEVDETFCTLKAQGVNIIKEPEKVYWGGYRGYIADPENNYWELAYNPFIEMDIDGNVLTHN